MDNVYEVFTTPREQTGLQGIHFRFMPDMQQVGGTQSMAVHNEAPSLSFQVHPTVATASASALVDP